MEDAGFAVAASGWLAAGAIAGAWIGSAAPPEWQPAALWFGVLLGGLAGSVALLVIAMLMELAAGAGHTQRR